jgi:dipeptidyl aminopeptidase/acylaminoacyl peptidase
MLKIILPLLALMFAGYVFFVKSPENFPEIIPDEVQTATATPFLFQEITIPYLRNRTYEGKLGELTKYSENSSYTSYLTNYDSDGFKINGLLTVPKGVEPEEGWPAIVFIHGYIPPTIYRTTERYANHVDYLAKNGFVVFKIDLRGHGSSEGEAGGAYYSGDYVIDTLNAYSALEKSDFVNPKGIGLWGHSMAGNVVARSVAVKKDIPAAVIWAGAGYTYTDLTTFRINDQSYRPPTTNTERARKRKLLNDTYGVFNEESWFWKLVPATNYLEGVKTSLQVHHSVDDDVVSIEYSRNLKRVLEGVSIQMELEEHPSGGHNISGSRFTDAMRSGVEFFRTHLGK